MQILEGKKVAESLRSAIIPRVESFKTRSGRSPHLVVVIVGEDKASHVYVKNKHIACEKVGMQSSVINLPEQTTYAELSAKLEQLSSDNKVDAILVQLPLPAHLDADQVLKHIPAEKDPDCLTEGALGAFFKGKGVSQPCTPQGVMRILQHYNIPVRGKNAVVVGRSNIVGKPMALMLTTADATVTVCHSKTPDLEKITSQADIVVVAAGKARFLGKEAFKKNSVVIDVGMHGSGGGQKLCGDVRYEELTDWVQAATPVPGGVGPMTIACLLENTLSLAEARLRK